jgi:hypothetical protein
MRSAQLPHLVVGGTAKAEAYTAHGSGKRASPPRVPDPERHGKRIRAQLEKAWEDAHA